MESHCWYRGHSSHTLTTQRQHNLHYRQMCDMLTLLMTKTKRSHLDSTDAVYQRQLCDMLTLLVTTTKKKKGTTLTTPETNVWQADIVIDKKQIKVSPWQYRDNILYTTDNRVTLCDIFWKCWVRDITCRSYDIHKGETRQDKTADDDLGQDETGSLSLELGQQWGHFWETGWSVHRPAFFEQLELDAKCIVRCTEPHQSLPGNTTDQCRLQHKLTSPVTFLAKVLPGWCWPYQQTTS